MGLCSQSASARAAIQRSSPQAYSLAGATTVAVRGRCSNLRP